MSDWKPIRRTGRPDADAIRFDERSGRIELHFPLSATPPAEWTQFLDRSWKDPNVPQPKVRGQTLVVWSKPSEAEFADWAKAVDGTIESANRYYTNRPLEADIDAAAPTWGNRTRPIGSTGPGGCRHGRCLRRSA